MRAHQWEVQKVKKVITMARFEPSIPWFKGRHFHHYTTQSPMGVPWFKKYMNLLHIFYIMMTSKPVFLRPFPSVPLAYSYCKALGLISELKILFWQCANAAIIPRAASKPAALRCHAPPRAHKQWVVVVKRALERLSAPQKASNVASREMGRIRSEQNYLSFIPLMTL